MIEVIAEAIATLVQSEVAGQVAKAVATLILSGTGLGLVLFLGTAIIRDLVQDIKGGQWKP